MAYRSGVVLGRVLVPSSTLNGTINSQQRFVKVHDQLLLSSDKLDGLENTGRELQR